MDSVNGIWVFLADLQSLLPEHRFLICCRHRDSPSTLTIPKRQGISYLNHVTLRIVIGINHRDAVLGGFDLELLLLPTWPLILDI